MCNSCIYPIATKLFWSIADALVVLPQPMSAFKGISPLYIFVSALWAPKAQSGPSVDIHVHVELTDGGLQVIHAQTTPPVQIPHV